MPVPVPILTFSELLVISAWLSAGHVLGCLIDHLPEYDSCRLTLNFVVVADLMLRSMLASSLLGAAAASAPAKYAPKGLHLGFGMVRRVPLIPLFQARGNPWGGREAGKHRKRTPTHPRPSGHFAAKPTHIQVHGSMHGEIGGEQTGGGEHYI